MGTLQRNFSAGDFKPKAQPWMGIWRLKSLCNLIVPILILYLCLAVCSCQALEETLLTAASHFVPNIFPQTELHRIYDPIFAFDLICKLPDSHQAHSRLLEGKSCLSPCSRLLKGLDQGCFSATAPPSSTNGFSFISLCSFDHNYYLKG